MKIAFLSNRITNRGTEVALYDYAHYNEIFLHNTSVVITRDLQKLSYCQDNSTDMFNKLSTRFPVFLYESTADVDKIIKEQGIDFLYVIKGGSNEGLVSKFCKTLVHCVFTTYEPHGDIYACIHDYVNVRCNTKYPVLPHMIHVHDTREDLRKELGIPSNAHVFGTYSGADAFDIEYVRKAVIDIKDPSIYFIFLGINSFCQESNVIFLPKSVDLEYKRKFINTCDAMLYGRKDGETFGLSIGEFSMCDKPVIMRGEAESFSHLLTLGDDCVKHMSYTELVDILTNWDKYKKDVTKNGYKLYTPKTVMAIFNRLLHNSLV
jgi:hypothetical protein